MSYTDVFVIVVVAYFIVIVDAVAQAISFRLSFPVCALLLPVVVVVVVVAVVPDQ